MEKVFLNRSPKSRVRAISSKSEAHRALICAALGDRECEIICNDTNADIDATVICLNSMGADILRTEHGFKVAPFKLLNQGCSLECNESGSTLRFLLPTVASLGLSCSFSMRGRLQDRPLSPLYELLTDSGVRLGEKGTNPLSVSGKLPSGNYSIAANVSSQYISGMLFALSVSKGESTLSLLGNVESSPYIDITVDTLMAFGADISYDRSSQTFQIAGKSRLHSPKSITVGGDWSNAAFFITAGVIGKKSVTVSGLNTNSRQGDRRIIEILRDMGADIRVEGETVIANPSVLHAREVDASDIPDLVPILSVAASVAEGKTVIYNASRLRLKESDRIESVRHTLSLLGADITATPDGLVIYGRSRLGGGTVDSYNDHRIAMSAAVASLICENAVKITDFEAINKSYPTFCDGWE